MMRAKLRVTGVKEYFSDEEKKEKSGETLTMTGVSRNEYDETGDDEDNTYAKWSPSASFEVFVANPNLWDKFKVDQKYYVDFTLAEEEEKNDGKE